MLPRTSSKEIVSPKRRSRRVSPSLLATCCMASRIACSVAALETDIAAPASPLIGKLELAAGIANAGRHLKLLLAKVASVGEIQSAFAAVVKELIEGQGETAAALRQGVV